MNKAFVQIVALSMVSQAAWAASPIFQDSFTGTGNANTNPTVWNTGSGAFFTNTSMRVFNFGGNFASKGDGTGAAGLNSNVGSASFTVAEDGVQPLGFNFQVGNTAFNNSAEALVRFDVNVRGVGLYEIAWNNSASMENFQTASGWAGTLTSGSYVIVVDDNRPSAFFGTTTTASGVDLGDPATMFGFWNGNNTNAAIIDNFKIYDSLIADIQMGTPGDFDDDGDVDGRDFLVWQRDTNVGNLTDWQDNYGFPPVVPALTSVPEPTALTLVVTMLLGIACRRRRG